MVLDPVAYLARDTLMVSAGTNVPSEVILAQALLGAIGIGGAELKWSRGGEPSSAKPKPSVSFLSSERSVPGWFRHRISALMEGMEPSNWYGTHPIEQVTNEEERQRLKQLAELAGGMLPGKKLDQGYADCSSRPTDTFLVEVGSSAPSSSVLAKYTSNDLFVLMRGAQSYKAILRTTRSAPFLKEAALNDSSGRRAVLHGWANRQDFRKIARGIDAEEVQSFGWLVSVEHSAAKMPGLSTSDMRCLSAFQPLFGLRDRKITGCYLAPAACVELLDQADSGWAPSKWYRGEVLEALARRNQALAWQIAAVLGVMSYKMERAPEEQVALAQLAASLAEWIRFMHCRELRLLFPGAPDDPTDKMSCLIADKLNLGQQSTRDLVRSGRGQKTEVVRSILWRMVDEGWVTEVSKDQWALSLGNPPDLSEILSETVNLSMLRWQK